MGVWIEISSSSSLLLEDPEVTPFVGVWIEMIKIIGLPSSNIVTPFVGVWIEILQQHSPAQLFPVTPFVGVWIEIDNLQSLKTPYRCHSLRGSVD